MTRRIAPAAAGIPALEPIRQDLYDTKEQVAAAEVGVLEFFRNPAQGGEWFTNMQGSGQLPNPQQFHAFGITVEMFPAPSVAIADDLLQIWAESKNKLRDLSFLRIRIGSKDYLTIPLKRVPEGVGPAGFGYGAVAIGTAAVAVTNGIQDIQHYYDLTIRQNGKIKPIHIPAQQAFSVQIIWPTPPTGLVPAAGMMKVRVYLIGILWREVQ